MHWAGMWPLHVLTHCSGHVLQPRHGACLESAPTLHKRGMRMLKKVAIVVAVIGVGWYSQVG
ncbi:MAG: hypothetical protein ACRC2X_06655, partial [Giesbergeria sp.]